MELARRASSAPSIFTSSGPSGARGAEPVKRTALPVPALIVDVNRGSSTGESAGARDIKRGQARIAHLRRDHALQTHPPFAGRIARRSPDRRLAVGDAG